MHERLYFLCFYQFYMFIKKNFKNKNFSKKICIENKACVIKKQFYIIIKKKNKLHTLYLLRFFLQLKLRTMTDIQLLKI